jgi:UDPglucose 6-dehydrogenase
VIVVAGLWHLGCVTAACLAKHESVVGYDEDALRVRELASGRAPLHEPGLDRLLAEGIARLTLSFSNDRRSLEDASIVWVTYDTPVDDEDEPDAAFVRDRIEVLFPHLRDGTIVVVSSQVPVGFTRAVGDTFVRRFPERSVAFVYAPENLRLGHAIETFERRARIVVGSGPDPEVTARIGGLLRRYGNSILWMSLESAEMAKHALNAFLGVSVAFSNEIARVCERTGADAKDVEAALRSDSRIGAHAYLSPGLGFSGGTLARDLRVLARIGADERLDTAVVAGAIQSNRRQQRWLLEKIGEVLTPLAGKRIAVLGLTYKPGTSTLRRSIAVELCDALEAGGAHVAAYDPSFSCDAERSESRGDERSRRTIEDALEGADAVAIATPWPQFASVDAGVLRKHMRAPIVLDPHRLVAHLRGEGGIRYYTVGVAP